MILSNLFFYEYQSIRNERSWEYPILETIIMGHPLFHLSYICIYKDKERKIEREKGIKREKRRKKERERERGRK